MRVGFRDVMNKQVQKEREEAESVFCGVQMDDVKSIFDFEKYMELSAYERTAAEQKRLRAGHTAVQHLV